MTIFPHKPAGKAGSHRVARVENRRRVLRSPVLDRRCPGARRSLSPLNRLAARCLAYAAITGVAILPAVSALAGESDSILALPEVVVSATRSEQSLVPTAAGITVITRDEIEASGASNLSQVLRGRGGVQITDTFGDGSRVSVGMRGFGESANANTLIMVDGRRLNNPDIGVPDLNSISLKDVERIEIIQGSAGTLFGDQAVGGVINIITRRPEGFQMDISGGVGSYRAWRGVASVSDRLEGGLAYRFTAERKRSDNYREHNESAYDNLFGRFDYTYGSLGLFAELQWVDDDLNTPGALLADELDTDRQQVSSDFQSDFTDSLTRVGRLGLTKTLSDHWSLETEAAVRETDGDFLLSFRGFPSTTPSTQERLVRTLTPRLLGTYDTARGELLLTVGFDLERSDYHLESVIGIQDNQQYQTGLYGQGVVPVLENLSLTLGAREARVNNELTDSFAFPSGVKLRDEAFVTEFGVVYRPASAWRFYARRDGNLRFPKVDEYTNAPPGVVLDTQTGVSWEAGAEWSGSTRHVKALVYRLDLDNEIAFDPETFSSVNLDATRRDGVILEAGLRPAESLDVNASYSYVDARVTSGPYEGNAIPLVAKHVLRFSADYRMSTRWHVYAELQANSHQAFSGDFDDQLDDLPGYTVVNLESDYHYRGWTFTGRVNNVLDREYSEFGSKLTLFPAPTFSPMPVESFFTSPERNFWFTARYAFF